MKYTDEYWNDRFPANTPERVKRAIERVYASYPKDCMMSFATSLVLEMGKVILI